MFSRRLFKSAFRNKFLTRTTSSIPTTTTSTKGKQNGSSSFFGRHYGKLFFAVLTTGITYTILEVQRIRNPPPQLPFDSSKKTIVCLGSGWSITSFLKDVDSENFNIIVISPRNYFLFTPLLPSTTTGTVELRSIMQPIRHITRQKKREIMFIEGDCTKIDPSNKKVTFEDNSELKGAVSKQVIGYDYLLIGTGAQEATWDIPGVRENACFLKEIRDARKIRTRLMDCIETAAFPGQPDSEINRLLHMVVVGGGPTGIEYAAELFDFLKDDLQHWYPDICHKVNITLIEAMPHVLPMFSKQLIEYTEKTFAENKVVIRNNTMVEKVRPKELVVKNPDGSYESIPYGLLLWATGNTAREVVKDLISKLPSEKQYQRRGLVVDDCLKVKGCEDVYCLGDASATKYTPTAQVASRQGYYLATRFNRIGYLLRDLGDTKAKPVIDALPPFTFDSLGMLAYIGNDRAIADFPGSAKVGGIMTFYLWKSVYLSSLFTWRNKLLVLGDWSKKSVFGRDIGRE